MVEEGSPLTPSKVLPDYYLWWCCHKIEDRDTLGLLKYFPGRGKDPPRMWGCTGHQAYPGKTSAMWIGWIIQDIYSIMCLRA